MASRRFFGPSRGIRKERGMTTPELYAEKSSLSSWAGVEDHLVTHDDGEMNDYADDIDTLLVFAGLFSAVLTAFITQTYPMLQPDGMDTTNQLLAFSIHAQLRATGTTISDTLYPTFLSSAGNSPATFAPLPESRWINILFFLSLIFSLAAALFGILAKQWLREYMKWNSPLAIARENVLVRQIRFEAWEAWRVGIVISSIPILLELGMFLFLGGVVILLWTLDDVVAKVVTVFAAAFLSIICAFTVLPIFSKRCPYRSPSAWAFLTAARAAKSFIVLAYWLFVLCGTFFLEIILYLAVFIVGLGGSHWEFELCQDVWEKCLSHIGWHMPSSWRDLDLERCFATTVPVGKWSKPVDLRAAARSELAKEKARFSPNGETAQQIASRSDTLDKAAEALLDNIAASSRLLRALSWVRQSSPDARVSFYVNECISTMHSDLLEPFGHSVSEWEDQIRMLTDRCLLTSVKENHRPDEPYMALLKDSEQKTPGEKEMGPQIDSDVLVSEQGHLVLRHGLRGLATSGLSRFSSLLIPSITHLSMEDISHFSAIASSKPQSSDTRAARQRAIELFSSVSIIPKALDDKEMWSLFLEAIGHMGPTTSPVITDISPDILVLAVRNGKVKISPGRTGLVLEGEGVMRAPDHELLLNYFSEKSDRIGSDNYLNLVVLTSIFWLRSGGIGSSAATTVDSVLAKMIAAAMAIQARSHRGTASRDRRDLLWIFELSRRSHALTSSHGPRSRHLFHMLANSFRRDLLVGRPDSVHEYLHDALQVAHKGRACEIPLCDWNTHVTCTRPWGICPLLTKRRGSGLSLAPTSPRSPGPFPLPRREPTEDDIILSPSIQRRPRSLRFPLMSSAASSHKLEATDDTFVESPISDPGHPSFDIEEGRSGEAYRGELNAAQYDNGRARGTQTFRDIVHRVISFADTGAAASRPALTQARSTDTAGSRGPPATRDDRTAAADHLPIHEVRRVLPAPTDPPQGVSYPPAHLSTPDLSTTIASDSPAATPGTSCWRPRPSSPLDLEMSPSRPNADHLSVRSLPEGGGLAYAATLFHNHSAAGEYFDRAILSDADETASRTREGENSAAGAGGG